MRHVLFLSMMALVTACGEREYEEPKVERTVEIEPPAGGGQSVPGTGDANPSPSDETDINKLVILFAAQANDEQAQLTLVPAAAEEDVLVMMPRGGSAVVIPPSADDVTNLTFAFVVRPAHAFPRPLNKIAATLDTYYSEAGSTEEKLYTSPLHGASDLVWQAAEGGGYGFGYGIRGGGFHAFNDQFGATRTIKSQFFTFAMTVEGGTQAIIATLPVMISN